MMPPKKRKIDTESKDEGSAAPEGTPEIRVKTEQLSQEDSKDASDQAEEKEGKPGAIRNLRPRKTTCYAEKDSPEINLEEKQKKGLRRKRRPPLNEDGSEEKESKIKRTEKSNDELAAASNEQPTSEVADDPEPPQPTLVLHAEEKCENEESITAADGESSSKQGTEKKRPKRKPKPKQSTSDGSLLDPNVVPKTEPASPSTNSEKKEKTSEGNKDGEVLDPAVKPKKKRIRNRKPAVAPSVTTEDGRSASGEQPVIKKEKDDNEGATDCEGKESGEKVKPPTVPKKKPTKKKAKPQVKKESLTTDGDNVDGDVNTEESKQDNNDELVDGGAKIKIEGEKEESKGETLKVAATIKKRVKKPKKPAGDAITDGGDGNSEAKAKAEESAEEKGKSSEDKEDGSGEVSTKVSAPPARKPFFRGRRSKSMSARSGRKEIVHTDEAIDPEDIRGFEHVEKYETPPGVRLPKFWDSEDEMSEDENNDNFRRIMCGFGTNCRIHEVIRPASEIVRRLKELQNTFGATKSLPLFQKDDLELILGDSSVSDSAEPFFRKDRDRTITWHTDPSFFKYANNYPSKCK